MRKVALLLAVSLFAAASLIASVPGAALAAKAKAKTTEPAADPNGAFLRALGDLGASFSHPYASTEPKGKVRKTAKR